MWLSTGTFSLQATSTVGKTDSQTHTLIEKKPSFRSLMAEIGSHWSPLASFTFQPLSQDPNPQDPS